MSINNAWAKLVTTQRQNAKISKRDLARSCNVDPSYISIIERDGYIPKRDKVMRIARALGMSEDLALLTAGYAPKSWSASYVFKIMSTPRSKRMILETDSNTSED